MRRMSVCRVIDAAPHLPPPNSLPPHLAAVCPLLPARAQCSASELHVKLERRSRALRNANGDLPTRPEGRARPFSRFGPILPSGARMGRCGGMNTDGAIRRIGPSQATGVCMGDQQRVQISRHDRWSGFRCIASPPAAELPPAPTRRGMSVRSRALWVKCARLARKTRKEIQGSQERPRGPSNSS